jgi:hypothetical protein
MGVGAEGSGKRGYCWSKTETILLVSRARGVPKTVSFFLLIIGY